MGVISLSRELLDKKSKSYTFELGHVRCQILGVLTRVNLLNWGKWNLNMSGPMISGVLTSKSAKLGNGV